MWNIFTDIMVNRVLNSFETVRRTLSKFSYKTWHLVRQKDQIPLHIEFSQTSHFLPSFPSYKTLFLNLRLEIDRNRTEKDQGLGLFIKDKVSFREKKTHLQLPVHQFFNPYP